MGEGGENGKYKVRGKMRENGRVCMGEVTEKGQSYRERMTEELARDRMTDRERTELQRKDEVERNDDRERMELERTEKGRSYRERMTEKGRS